MHPRHFYPANIPKILKAARNKLLYVLCMYYFYISVISYHRYIQYSWIGHCFE